MPDPPAVRGAARQAVEKAWWRGSVGLSDVARGKSKVACVSGGPAVSPALNSQRCPKGHGWLYSGRLSPGLRLRCPQYLALWRQSQGVGPSVADIGLGLGPRSPQA